MPLIIIKSSARKIDQSNKDQIHEQAESTLSRILNKSRDYVMSILEFEHEISFGGDESAPSAYIEIKNVGNLTPEITESLSKEITALITRNIGVPKNRVYIEFQQSDRHMWGWDGSTFR
jgi:phenylpyruvate tautomerase